PPAPDGCESRLDDLPRTGRGCRARPLPSGRSDVSIPRRRGDSPMEMNPRLRASLHRAGQKARKHAPKVGIGAGLLAAGYVVFVFVTVRAINQLSVEDRFERAEKDIAGGPQQEVCRQVLRHEALVRALAARGSVPPPLQRTDKGIVDPVLREALQPPTWSQRMHLRDHPGRDPEALAKRLDARNDQLVRELNAAGGSPRDLEPDVSTWSRADANPALRPARIERPETVVRPREAPSEQAAESEARLKALCAATG